MTMHVQYGKAAVAFYRSDGRSSLFAGEVRLEVFGQNIARAWTEGDNAVILPTDTMKNFIHARALEYPGASLEEFLEHLGRQFLAAYGHVEEIRMRARELPFARETRVLFRRIYDDYGIAELTLGRSGILDHRSGREALHLIKLTGSSFARFLRDDYTTLPEMEDRPLFIYLNAYWRHRSSHERVTSEQVRGSLLATFDSFVSRSIQHLVHEMGQRLLAGFPAIAEVSFEAENRLWDTAEVSAANPRVKVYCDPRPPYGASTLTLTR